MYVEQVTKNVFIVGYKRTSRLHVVKIYYATPTFDRITKDEKANFESKLSTIGGTMGLFTGFSIISGVEIIYFLAKISFSFIKKKIIYSKKIGSHIK